MVISPAAAQAAGVSTIHLQANRKSVEMGRSLTVVALAKGEKGAPAPGVELWPYVNGRRWGAQAATDAMGQALFLLPLPHPGTTSLQVIAAPPKPAPGAYWIWAASTQDNQTLYFRKTFRLEGRIRRAVLHITCDDTYHAYLDGRLVASGTSFQVVQNPAGLERFLQPGLNSLTVEGTNGAGPAGLAARLEVDTTEGARSISTDASWEVFQTKPDGWPQPGPGKGLAAALEAPLGEGVWGSSPRGWPGLSPRNIFPVGLPIPSGALRSNLLKVAVQRRTLHVVRDPDHLVGMEWEPWFTPQNARWDTAEAVPLVGYYDSFNADVIRQHCLWMVDAGVNFLLVDWSNNLWGKKHWTERPPGVDELIRGTTLMLDTYAQMRQEGIPVPQVTLLLGLDNGPTTTMQALNEEMDWVYNHYVRNPRYKNLWLYYEGKPLVVPFNGGGPAIRAGQPPDDETHFTVRWMASQLQISHLNEKGYWSWMDGVIHPELTTHNGAPEILTVTPAFFGDGGWTYPQARGRRGGATYLEEFTTALQYHPHFLLINQWNEFAGQPEGGGFGPRKDQFVDTYNVPLSDDIEPTSLTACAYRGCGGWGFYYLNLTRALVQLYYQNTPEDTILAVSSPERGQEVTGAALPVEWTVIGRPARDFSVALDGKVIARHLPGFRYNQDLAGLSPGPHTLTLTAEGASTHFPLSYIEEDPLLSDPIPVSAEVPFVIHSPGTSAAREDARVQR